MPVGNTLFLRVRGLLLAVLVCSGCAHNRPRQKQARPLPPEVAERVSPSKHFDNRPFSLILHPRREEIRPLVDFEQVLPWSVAASLQKKACFTRSFAEQLWGMHTGLLEYREVPAGTWIPVQVDVPLRAPAQFDSLDIWVMRSGKVPGQNPKFRIVLTNEAGERFATPARVLDWEGWGLLHWNLNTDFVKRPVGPLYISSIEVQSGGEGHCDVYMDSLSAYREQMAPILSSSNLSVDAGLTGDASGSKVDSLHLVKLKEEMYALRGVANGHTWSWHFDPRYGGEGLEFWYDGVFVNRPLSASFFTGLNAGFPALIRTYDQGLDVHYEHGLELRLRGKGRALVMEVESPGNSVEVMSMGRIEGCDVHEVSMPLIDTFHRALLRIARWSKPDLKQSLYMSFAVDSSFSSSSELAAGSDARENGVLLYYPDSSGRRSGLKERLTCTVSEHIEDVLPSISIQPADQAARAASCVWVEAGDEVISTPEELFELPSWWPEKGLDNLVLLLSERVWMDEGIDVDNDLSTVIGSPERLSTELNKLGQRGAMCSVPAMVREISPLSSRWNRSVLQREPDLSWRGRPDAYRLKSSLAQRWMPDIVAKWKALYGVEAVSVTGPGRAPPWWDTDYDERTPVSAQWAPVVGAYATMLKALSEELDGVVSCAGPGAWLYAGSADAVQIEGPQLPKQGDPWQPLFALYCVAPRSAMVGLGAYQDFTRGVQSAPSDSVDAYLATELAHGCAGLVPLHGMLSEALQARMAFMSLWVQQQRGLQVPKEVSYWDGAGERSCSDALASQVWKRSQLCIRYPNGLTLWMNGHATEHWTVMDAGQSYELPPNGYVVKGPDLFEFSGLVDGRRLDYVETPECLYVDGRGRLEPYQGLVAPTPLLVLKSTPETWRLVDPSGSGRFGFFGLGWKRVESIEWLDAKGQPVVTEPVRANGGFWITLPEGVRSAVFHLQKPI